MCLSEYVDSSEYSQWVYACGMPQTTWTVARQIAFRAPADMRGKWHASWLVTGTPVCGAAVTLGSEVIHAVQGQESARVHPMVCRRCLRLSTTPGVSASGIAR